MITAIKGRRRTADQPSDDVSHESQTMMDAFQTALGWMAIAWKGDALCGIVFGHGSRRSSEMALARNLGALRSQGDFAIASSQQELPHGIKEVIDALQRYAEGEPIEFVDVPLALDHLTPFGRRVVAACRRIGWGNTSSYGDLAEQCEAPGAARAVGTVMAKNRYPLVVPCHRVLAAGGALGGYSAPDGLRMKRRLLEMEGSAVC